MAAGTAQARFAIRQFPKLQRTASTTLIILSSLAFRLIRLGTKSLWLDETYRIYLASMDWHDFLRAAVQPFGANSLLFHFLLRYWLLLGNSEAMVRGLSVVFGVATVFATYKIGAELFDDSTGLIAAALVGTNALLISYSQEICAYGLAALLAVLSSWSLLRALKNNERGAWAAYIVSATCMLFCHVLSFLVVVAHAVSFLLARKGRLSIRPVASFAMLGIAFAFLAWCIAIVPPHLRVWMSPPGWRELKIFLADFGGPVFLLFVLLSFKNLVRGDVAVNTVRGRYLFLTLWALLPPVLLFLVSQRIPMFLDRYLLPSVPPFLLLVAATVRQLKDRRLAALWTAILLAVSIYGSVLYLHYRADPQRTYDWRDATAYLAQQVRSGDVVVFYYHHERLPFDYYRGRIAEGFAAQVIPTGSNEALLEDPDPIESDASAAAMAKSYSRVWLVYSAALAATKYGRLADLRVFHRQLARSFQTSSEANFGNIRVTLFAGPQPNNK